MAKMRSFKFYQPKVSVENVRKQDSAFFETEGLMEFLHLDWDIKVDANLIFQFALNYDVQNRTVKMRGEEIAIGDELMLEVFRLPRGDYKMANRSIKGTRIVSAPYFTEGRESWGFRIASCNDNVWLDRLYFLQYLTLEPWETTVDYRLIEFLQAKGKKRDWFDAFMCFFQEQILLLTRKVSNKLSVMITGIGSHIALILAHIEKKKKPQEVGLRQKSVTGGQLTPKKMDRKEQKHQSSTNTKRGDDENEAEEKEGENSQNEVKEEQNVHPSLTSSNVEDHILHQHDMDRQGISEMLNRVAGLRSEVGLQRSEYGNRIAVLRNENDSLQKEVELWKNNTEKWKRECEKLEKALEELEAQVAAFCTTVDARKLTRTLSKDNASLGSATPTLSKRLKLSELPKA